MITWWLKAIVAWDFQSWGSVTQVKAGSGGNQLGMKGSLMMQKASLTRSSGRAGAKFWLDQMANPCLASQLLCARETPGRDPAAPGTHLADVDSSKLFVKRIAFQSYTHVCPASSTLWIINLKHAKEVSLGGKITVYNSWLEASWQSLQATFSFYLNASQLLTPNPVCIYWFPFLMASLSVANPTPSPSLQTVPSWPWIW